MEPDHTEQSRDDLDVGWGERPPDHQDSRDRYSDDRHPDDRHPDDRSTGDARLLDERPPHHDRG